jgi:hypothetical protein
MDRIKIDFSSMSNDLNDIIEFCNEILVVIESEKENDYFHQLIKSKSNERRINPLIRPHLILGIKNHIDNTNQKIEIIGIPPKQDIYNKRKISIPIPWDVILSSLTASVGLICAAGGSKSLIDLLKIWVENKKSRKVKIKKGDIEIEINGDVSLKQLKNISNLFEETFHKPHIYINDLNEK